jgi:predicted permease
MFDAAKQDLRYAMRGLWRSPVFAATAVLSLAIGIGANTTIFSVASALLLRPLPGLTDPSRIVDIGRTQNGRGFDTSSYPNYQDFRERVTTLDSVYAGRIDPVPMSLAENGQAERVYGMIVSGNYFDVLGTRPQAGRLLQDSDDRSSSSGPVAVIAHDLWMRRFGSQPDVVNRTVVLNGYPFTIVGIAPAGFQGTTVLKPDLWVPVSNMSQAMPRSSPDVLSSRRSVWLFMGGRLKPGVTVAQADAEARAIGSALEREYPDENRGKSFRVDRTALVPGQVSAVAGFIALLMTIVGLVLLIACINLSGMLLARGAARQREIAVRLAIGASRGRLVRQLLTETGVLFVFGGLIGIVISEWLTSVMLSQLPALPLPLFADVEFDWRVLAFAIAIAFIAGGLAGLAPALQASRLNFASALKSDAFNRAPGRLRLRSAFVVGQVTISLVLVIGAGLLLRALQHASSIEPGFDQRNVEIVSLDLSVAGYKDETVQPFVHELTRRVANLPGVAAASAALDLPLDGNRVSLGGIRVPGLTPTPDEESFEADWNAVEPGYFRTLRLPFTLGRDFTEADVKGAQPVAIVNEAFARRAWPGRNPIGQQIERLGTEKPVPLTVVGVVSDAKLVTLDAEPGPFICVPFAQDDILRVSLVVRSTSGQTVIPQVRELVRRMNPYLPIDNAMRLSQLTSLETMPQRIAAAVAGSFGVVGVLLAGIGLYGVTAYAVSRRTREIGIRIALGAAPATVMRMVLAHGFTLAMIGVAIGTVFAALASRALESLLFGIPSLDLVTFAAAALLFVAMTMVASYVPARRAMRVNPLEALRAE